MRRSTVDALADLPLDRPVGTVVLLASLVVLGAVATAKLPLGFVPPLDEPAVDITAPLPGGHPLEALEEVGRPIEEEVAAVEGIQRLRTVARQGVVEVHAGFDWSADVDLKKLEVRDAVARARERMPAGVGHIRVEGAEGGLGGSVLQGRLAADRDLSRSWALLERGLERPLERVRGVARVHLYGVEPPQVRIDLDLVALRRHSISAQDVLERVEQGNVDLDVGPVRDGRLRHDVHLAGRLATVADVRAIPVAPGLRLGDVARVEERPPRLDYGRHLDRRPALGIDVFKEPSANAVETVDRLKARLAEVERDPELEGIRLLIWQDAGEEVRRSLRALLDAGWQGALLAVLVLLLFLRRAGTTLVVTLAIPFSLVVACGALLLLGGELNVITMLGLMLGVGMLVDNAVVVAEAIVRLQEEGRPPLEAARAGLREVWLAVVASTATTVVVWGWLLVADRSPLVHYLNGVALTIGLSVTASLLVSVTLIPLATARLGAPATRPAAEGTGRLAGLYRALLAWTLRRRAAALALLLGVAGSAAWPLARLEKQGEPRMRQRQATIHYSTREPQTKERLERHVDAVEAWLETRRADLGIETTYSWFSETEGCLTFVYLPQAAATAERLAALREALRAGLPRLPGVTLEVGDRAWGGPRGGGDARRVSVELTGDDPAFLGELAARAEERLRGLPGVLDLRGPGRAGGRELRVRVDADRARALGVTPLGVGEVVRFALRGRPLSRFRGPDGELELRSGVPEEGFDLAALERFPVPVSTGTTPLATVATLQVARTSDAIERRERRTATWVGLELDATVTTEETQAAVRERLAGLPLPPGYGWSFGEWGRERDETLQQMSRGVGLSLLLVVLLMAALFESVSQPVAVVITLPLAFTGAFWALWLAGFELDAVAFIGVILLVGVVVNNGIVMVDRINALRAEGVARTEAVLLGCAQRLRPVLMTALTTLAGLLPLALTGPTVAGAYIDSLAVAVIGGLATSTLFTLVALPVWYTTVEDVAGAVARSLPHRA